MNKIKIEIDNEQYEIIDDEYFETWDINDKDILIINKWQTARNIILDLINDDNHDVVDNSALDEAIWSLVDDIGAEIKSIAYEYADNNNIEIEY